MKKITALLLALIIALLAFTSCEYIFGSVGESGTVTVVVENADGSLSVFEVALSAVENKDNGAEGVLEHLSNKNDGLYLEMIDGGYGAYVTAIGNIKEIPSDGMYVIVYTSVKADSYEGAPTVDYRGTMMYQAGIGLSGMTVYDGTVILFRLEKSPY